MSDHNDLLQRAEEQARAAIEARMESVRVLVATAARVNDLTDELKAAQRDHKNAWQRAIKQGWSAEELRRTGLTDPTTRRPPRRKPAAQTSTERSVEQPAQSPEH